MTITYPAKQELVIIATTSTKNARHCSCGGKLSILPLTYQEKRRWAHKCKRCGAIWSVNAWHRHSDEARNGTLQSAKPII